MAFGQRRVARGGRRAIALATLALMFAFASGTLVPANAEPELAPFEHAVNVIPTTTPKVGSCIPFGNNKDWGFSGFIYRNVAPFVVRPGTTFAFDLGNTNDVDIRRNIYFANANVNPAPGNGNVRALSWTKVVSETQLPENPRGNTVIGDYELRYTSEANFTFSGGGFIVGFSASPPSAYADRGCEQVLVHTGSTDASNNFYGRFFSRPDQDTSFLNRGTFGTTLIGGIVIFGDSIPPVVSAAIDPAPGPDGWVRMTDGTATVAFTGVDDETGIETCSEPVVLSDPGVHQLRGGCTDGAGNVGTLDVTVRIARAVGVELGKGNNETDVSNEHRAGRSTFVVSSTPIFDAHTIDPASVTFGVSGAEPSVEECKPAKADLACRFDVEAAGHAETLHFEGFADGGKVSGSDTVRVVGQPSNDRPA